MNINSIIAKANKEIKSNKEYQEHKEQMRKLQKYMNGNFTIRIATEDCRLSPNDGSDEKSDIIYVLQNWQIVDKVVVRSYVSESWSTNHAYGIKGGHTTHDNYQVGEDVNLPISDISYESYSNNMGGSDCLNVRGFGTVESDSNRQDYELEDSLTDSPFYKFFWFIIDSFLLIEGNANHSIIMLEKANPKLYKQLLDVLGFEDKRYFREDFIAGRRVCIDIHKDYLPLVMSFFSTNQKSIAKSFLNFTNNK